MSDEAAAISVTFTTNAAEQVAAVLAILGVAALGAVGWWLFPWFIIWIVRRGVSQPNGPCEVALGEDAVRIQAPFVTAEWKWAAFHHARETSRFFLLYFSKSQAQFIPKRALSQGQAERIRALIARQVAKRTGLTESERLGVRFRRTGPVTARIAW